MKGVGSQLIADDQLPGVLKPVFDVKYDASGKIISGLVIGSTQAQNEALILMSNPGEYKNSPTLGVGLENALLSATTDMLRYRHAVRRNYDLEGLDITELDLFSLDKINIVANYR